MSESPIVLSPTVASQLVKRANQVDAGAAAGDGAYKEIQTTILESARKLGLSPRGATSAVIMALPLLGDTQERMRNSMNRVSGMREFVAHLNSMAEAVAAHALGSAKA